MVQLIIIVFLCLSILYCSPIESKAFVFSSSAHHLCHPDDALSLLQFKEDMLHITESFTSYLCGYHGQYSYPKMMTWNNTSSDCCTWDGVTCHQVTGRVIGLDLNCSRLMGVIHQNSTLFRLSHLQKLNLADNDFHGNVPSKISHLSNLISLDLSDNFFLKFNPGDFQILLRNLTHIIFLSLYGVQIQASSQANWSSSSLTYLDLGYTGIDGKLSNSTFHLPLLQTFILSGNENLSVGLPKGNCLLDGIPDFICSFASLKQLDLSNCGLSGYFTNSIGNLSQIVRLSLFQNNFKGNISPIILNLPKLRELDLHNNSFSGSFPSYIGNLTELTMLGLQHNLLRGPLPSNMSGLQNLSKLYLSNNEFDGTIPSWVFSVPSLTTLSLGDNSFKGQIKEFVSKSLDYVDFGGNQLDGSIPHSISQLVNLKLLHLECNKLCGPIPDSIFQLVNLQYLHLGGNQLEGLIPDSIFQLVNLSSLYLQSNNLSGSIEFTMFSHLKNLEVLDLSNNKLALKIENKSNVIFSHFSMLRLSSCGITEFPDFLKNSNNLVHLDLSNNKIHGQIPNWIPKDSLRFLNLSHNSLSSLGSLNTLTLMKHLYILDLGSNNFQEPFPLSICSLVQLSIIDLSHNNFTGLIPECFGNFSTQLQVMNLAKNDLKGAIAMTFPKNSCKLLSLSWNGNSLEGLLPMSLANCKFLEILDFGNNKINDAFPTFLENLVELQVLILKSNRFFGSISNFKNENFLPKLLVFDLSCNEFNGALPPELFKSFKAMASLGKIEPRASYMRTSDSLYYYSMNFVMKGNFVVLVEILTTFVVIDLSSNNFTGDIPEIIGNLNLLIALNLSHNNFSGRMPFTLGMLYFLESLDLSWNQIEGEIPWQLVDITNLEFLNVSKNHLQGRIPQGKQFYTFLNDSYYGNFELCGFPVTKNCGEIDLHLPPSRGSYQDDEDYSFWSAFTWKSMFIGYGFGFANGCQVFFSDKPKWLARNVEDVCWYALLLLGKKEMCEQFSTL